MSTQVAGTATSTEGPTLLVLEEKQPMTTEAYDWMMSINSLPGCGLSPIRFIGLKNIERLSEALGHQITLEEAKILVRLDGDKMKCDDTEREFQPIAYWPYINADMEKDLASGKTLAEISVPFGGAFFLEGKQIFAFSGPVYDKLGASWMNESPLVKASKEAGFIRKLKRPIWGKCFQVLADYLSDEVERKRRQQESRDRIKDKFSGKKRGLNKLNNVFASLELED